MDKYVASRLATPGSPGPLANRPAGRTREPVIALHCSVAGGGQWRRLGEALGARYELIAPGFYGGGSTGPWPGDRAFSLEAEARRIIAILDGLDCSVHLVGHAYGGAVALEAARARPGLVASLALYEPAGFHLLRTLGGRAAAELREVEALAATVCAGLVNGTYQSAAAAFVDYWKGAGTWDALWPEARERLIDGLPRAALDLLALTEHEMPEAAYGRIRCPTLIMRGEHARAPSRLIAAELARRLPCGLLEVLPGAGHMGPLTHPGEVNRLIAGCIRANPARAAASPDAALIAA
jgi:pimeloyl-ACP methyl ester carboxylesterase